MREVLSWLDENAERWMLLFLYSFIVLVIAIEVLRRFVLMYSSVWGEEAARYAFIYLVRSEEHTSELQSLMRRSYAVYCLKKKNILLDISNNLYHDKIIIKLNHTI